MILSTLLLSALVMRPQAVPLPNESEIFPPQQRTKIAADAIVLGPIPPETAAALNNIRTYIESQAFTTSDRIVAARQFVYRNSLHAPLQAYSWDIPKVVAMLWATQSTGATKPSLMCGPRTFALQMICDKLGLKSRQVAIFTDASLASHTFLEVYNADTSRWEIADSDFNVNYVSLVTGERLQAAEIIWGNLDEIVPENGTVRGWTENGVAHLKRWYFESAMYAPRDLANGQYTIVVNPERFDTTKVFTSVGATFFDYARKRYRFVMLMEARGAVLAQ